jgi:DNA-binding LacI/PurR family transcriptional regulator
MTPDRTSTLQDVADRAAVSRATASQALAGKGRMSPETRQRVRDAADELAYTVNRVARGLRTSRTGVVGLCLPDQTLSFKYYMDVAFGAVERAQESGMLVTLLPPAFDGPVATEQLDGYLAIDPVDGDPLVARLLAGRKPVVSGERSPEGLPAPWAVVHGDHEKGMRLLLDHLWERGARRPAVMLPDPAMAWGREMAAGYRGWCAEHGVEPRQLLGWFDTSIDRVRQLLDEEFARGEHPDSVITAPEGMALVAMDAVRAAGLTPGTDVLIASYVDSDALAAHQPTVTALDLHPREMGRRCMDELVRALDGGPRGRSVELPIDLVVRESTAG